MKQVFVTIEILLYLVVEGIFVRVGHEPVEVVGHVLPDEPFLLLQGHVVVEVLLDSVVLRVRVVDHGLVDVYSKIHGHRVPASVLIVNQDYFSVIRQRHKNVVLMDVVVAEHGWERVFVWNAAWFAIMSDVERAVGGDRN